MEWDPLQAPTLLPGKVDDAFGHLIFDLAFGDMPAVVQMLKITL